MNADLGYDLWIDVPRAETESASAARGKERGSLFREEGTSGFPPAAELAACCFRG